MADLTEASLVHVHAAEELRRGAFRAQRLDQELQVGNVGLAYAFADRWGL